MTEEPIAELPYAPAYAGEGAQHGTLTWTWALERLTNARNFWLATVRPEGRPHLMPIWCVWHENALYFSTDPTSRKARNFTLNANVSVSTDGAGASVIIEGSVWIVDHRKERELIAKAYAAKYEWAMEATDDGVKFDDDVETPLYVVLPALAFGITDDEVSKMTRWRFPS
jgi:nitroimidazol reductase NimA-like FMN-containing flavoprotein (pyridoxamine 5'-phosphate oxidase superfamily)